MSLIKATRFVRAYQYRSEKIKNQAWFVATIDYAKVIYTGRKFCYICNRIIKLKQNVWFNIREEILIQNNNRFFDYQVTELSCFREECKNMLLLGSL